MKSMISICQTFNWKEKEAVERFIKFSFDTEKNKKDSLIFLF